MRGSDDPNIYSVALTFNDLFDRNFAWTLGTIGLVSSFIPILDVMLPPILIAIYSSYLAYYNVLCFFQTDVDTGLPSNRNLTFDNYLSD